MMGETLWSMPEVRAVVFVTMLVVLVIVAVYAVLRVRSWLDAPVARSSEHLAEFQEMAKAGRLDREEYDRVRRAMGPQLRREASSGSGESD